MSDSVKDPKNLVLALAKGTDPPPEESVERELFACLLEREDQAWTVARNIVASLLDTEFDVESDNDAKNLIASQFLANHDESDIPLLAVSLRKKKATTTKDGLVQSWVLNQMAEEQHIGNLLSASLSDVIETLQSNYSKLDQETLRILEASESCSKTIGAFPPSAASNGGVPRSSPLQTKDYYDTGCESFSRLPNTVQEFMPYAWSCPETNDVSLVLQDRVLLKKNTRRSAIVVANKPIPMQKLTDAARIENRVRLSHASKGGGEHPEEVTNTSLLQDSSPMIRVPTYYFEVTLKQGRSVWIGFIPKDRIIGSNSSANHPHNVLVDQVPVRIPGAVGLNSNGLLLLESRYVHAWEGSFGGAFKEGDTLGCGIEVIGQKHIFFTKNGTLVGNPRPACSARNDILLPAVALRPDTVEVVANFGSDPSREPFLWKGDAKHPILAPERPHTYPSTRPFSPDEPLLTVTSCGSQNRCGRNDRVIAVGPVACHQPAPRVHDSSKPGSHDMPPLPTLSGVEASYDHTNFYLGPDNIVEYKSLAAELTRLCELDSDDTQRIQELVNKCDSVLQKVQKIILRLTRLEAKNESLSASIQLTKYLSASVARGTTFLERNATFFKKSENGSDLHMLSGLGEDQVGVDAQAVNALENTRDCYVSEFSDEDTTINNDTGAHDDVDINNSNQSLLNEGADAQVTKTNEEAQDFNLQRITNEYTSTPSDTTAQDDFGGNDRKRSLLDESIDFKYQEEQEIVESLALYNYEKFYKLPHGSVNLYFVKASSAGIAGWAACRLDNTVTSSDSNKKVKVASPCANPPGDAEEALQLQATLLESMGVHVEPKSTAEQYVEDYYRSKNDDEESHYSYDSSEQDCESFIDEEQSLQEYATDEPAKESSLMEAKQANENIEEAGPDNEKSKIVANTGHCSDGESSSNSSFVVVDDKSVSEDDGGFVVVSPSRPRVNRSSWQFRQFAALLRSNAAGAQSPSRHDNSSSNADDFEHLEK